MYKSPASGADSIAAVPSAASTTRVTSLRRRFEGADQPPREQRSPENLSPTHVSEFGPVFKSFYQPTPIHSPHHRPTVPQLQDIGEESGTEDGARTAHPSQPNQTLEGIVSDVDAAKDERHPNRAKGSNTITSHTPNGSNEVVSEGAEGRAICGDQPVNQPTGSRTPPPQLQLYHPVPVEGGAPKQRFPWEVGSEVSYGDFCDAKPRPIQRRPSVPTSPTGRPPLAPP